MLLLSPERLADWSASNAASRGREPKTASDGRPNVTGCLHYRL
jgi:hypothetical protein